MGYSLDQVLLILVLFLRLQGRHIVEAVNIDHELALLALDAENLPLRSADFHLQVLAPVLDHHHLLVRLLLVLLVRLQPLLQQLVLIPQLPHLMKQEPDLVRVVLGLADLLQGLALLRLDPLEGGCLCSQLGVLLFHDLKLGLEFVHFLVADGRGLRVQFLGLLVLDLGAHLLQPRVQLLKFLVPGFELGLLHAEDALVLLVPD